LDQASVAGDRAGGWLQQTANLAQQGCLAGAIGTDNPDEVAVLRAERNLVQDRQAVLAAD
jgi:hypothetical protein